MSAETADAVFDEIVSAVQRGDRKAALALAVSAHAQGLDEPLVLLLTADALEEEGRADEALNLISRAADIAPDEPGVWHRLGSALLNHGRDRDGQAAFRTALSLTPDSVAALIGAGTASFRLGELTAAEQDFASAVALAPQEAEALAALAAIAARRRRPDEARSLAGRALALRPDIVAAELALGRADLLEMRLADVCERMTRLQHRDGLTDEHRIAALDLRAEALDLMDRAPDAFDDYAARNDILRRRASSRITQEISERRADQIRRLNRYFATAPTELWRNVPGYDGAGSYAGCGHVFLLGFPRSGTTLLEKTLAAHPAVVTLEEVDHLGRVSQPWFADARGLEALAHLSPAEAMAVRADYWSSVQATLGQGITGKVVVDKLPLHTLVLPAIAKLFPQARILLALRDPRDVVLSCFRRRFQMNSAMFEFLRLQDAAHYYDEVMTFAERCRMLLPLAVHEIRYEAVVADFESTMRDVLAFVGLEWVPTMARFAERLPEDPRTPSDVQLQRGLNAEGIGQWRRYAPQLAPVLPILASWAARFGYQNHDDATAEFC